MATKPSWSLFPNRFYRARQPKPLRTLGGFLLGAIAWPSWIFSHRGRIRLQTVGYYSPFCFYSSRYMERLLESYMAKAGWWIEPKTHLVTGLVSSSAICVSSF